MIVMMTKMMGMSKVADAEATVRLIRCFESDAGS